MEGYGKTELAWRDCWIEIHLDGGLWKDRAGMERLLDKTTSRGRLWKDRAGMEKLLDINTSTWRVME